MNTNKEHEWVEAAKLREVIWEMRETIATARDTRFENTYSEATERWVEQLEALLPDPKPRTLAEMTREEREACQWMQATFTKSNHEHIITQVSEKKARLLRRADGAMFEVRHDEVIPLLHLPSMTWPGSEPGSTHFDNLPDEAKSVVEESIEDYRAGNFVDFDRSPRPEDVPEGEPWIVDCYGDRYVGTREPHCSTNWALAQMDGTDVTFACDREVTLVSRLVPGEQA